MTDEASPDSDRRNSSGVLAAGHRRFAWTCLALFIVLGIALEALHGFKLELYVSAANETRRLMWRLAHAHGTLLALINLAYASAFETHRVSRGALHAMKVAALGLPLGFFAGGIVIHGGDPGLGILLVPPAELALLWGVVAMAAAHWRREDGAVDRDL